MNYTQPVRKTVVTKVHINHVKADDQFFPSWAFPEGEKPEEIWWVWLTTRSGLLPERISHRLCHSEVEAQSCVSRHPVGSELSHDVGWPGFEDKRHQYIRDMVDSGEALGVGNAGDRESPLAFDVLDKAGVTEFYSGLSPAARNYLGKRRIGELKARFGENWTSAAAFEYCSLTLSPSSPAYVAAAYQFHYYITHDDFTAGYLWRDLECLVHGVESAAIKSLEMRRKAGAKGSAKSAASRAARRNALIAAMESTAKRNPDIAKLGPKAMAELALPVCIENNPSIWSQGRGQVEEYLGEIRRGEAGDELQARYLVIFPPKLTLHRGTA